MPTPSIRHADKANLKELFAGLKQKYEPKDATIVHDAGYVHTDENYTAADKAKLDGIDAGATAYAHPTHPANTGKPTADQTPAFGASFTVSQVTSDGYGHVTGMTDRDVTIPSTEATTTTAGLMSATDKAKLDGIDRLTNANVDTVADDGTLASDNLLDGTGLTRLWSKIKAKFASITHEHAADDITSGTLPIARGGTGATTAAAARTQLDAAQRGSASVTLGEAQNAVSMNRQNESTSTSFYVTGTYFWLNGRLKMATKTINPGDEISSSNAETVSIESELVDLRQSIAPRESTTAVANHAVGDYFMLGNVLMKATAAIAAGETISTSNAFPASVQSQIDTLRSSVDTKNYLWTKVKTEEEDANHRIGFGWRRTADVLDDAIQIYVDEIPVVTLSSYAPRGVDNAAFRKIFTNHQITVPANGGTAAEWSISNLPDGFAAIAIAGFNTGNPSCYFATVNIQSTDSKVNVYVKNTSSEQKTITADIGLLCLVGAMGSA